MATLCFMLPFVSIFIFATSRHEYIWWSQLEADRTCFGLVLWLRFPHQVQPPAAEPCVVHSVYLAYKPYKRYKLYSPSPCFRLRSQKPDVGSKFLPSIHPASQLARPSSARVRTSEAIPLLLYVTYRTVCVSLPPYRPLWIESLYPRHFVSHSSLSVLLLFACPPAIRRVSATSWRENSQFSSDFLSVPIHLFG